MTLRNFLSQRIRKEVRFIIISKKIQIKSFQKLITLDNSPGIIKELQIFKLCSCESVEISRSRSAKPSSRGLPIFIRRVQGHCFVTILCYSHKKIKGCEKKGYWRGRTIHSLRERSFLVCRYLEIHWRSSPAAVALSTINAVNKYNCVLNYFSLVLMWYWFSCKFNCHP